MEWERTHETAEKIEWERADGYAYVVARATADGEWAVSPDRLEQAPEGKTYRHESVPRLRDGRLGRDGVAQQ